MGYLPDDIVLDPPSTRATYGSGGVEDDGNFQQGAVPAKIDQLPAGATDATYDPTTGDITGYKDANGRLVVNINGGASGGAFNGQQNQDGTPTGGTILPDDVQLDAEQPQQAQTIAQGIGGGVRNIIEGSGNLLNTVTAPIRAPMAALGLPVDYAKDASDLADKLGLSHIDGVAGAIQKGMTEGLLTAGAGSALGAADGVAGTVGDALAEKPIAQAIASGSAEGASEAAREDGANPYEQIGASLLGGLAGGAATIGAGSLPNFRMANRTLNPLGQAYKDQGVSMMPAAVGGTAAQMATGVTHMTLGGIPLAEAAERSIQTAQNARNAIAAKIGTAADTIGAGQATQRGAQSFMTQSEARGVKLYDAIPIAANKPAVLSNSRQALADLNTGLESNPELSALLSDPRLQAYERAIAGTKEDVPTGLLDADGNPMMRTVQKGGKLSWQDLKSFRSYVGELAGRPTLQDSTAKNDLQRLYAGLSDDMRATAEADGPKSLAAFNRANTYWRGRQTRIDNVLSAVLGKSNDKGPQAAFNQIQSWATNKGEAIKLAQALRSMPSEEADTVRASVFNRLGNVTAGRQGVAGDTFSPNDFMTHWNALSGRAKSVLFPGIDYRNDIDQMVQIAGSMKDAGKYANTSKTSLGTNALALLGAFFSNPLYALGIGSTEFGAGKLLASRRVAAWMASAPKKPNAPAALAHINRLSAIAVAEPAISNEILALQQRLASAFTDSGAKLAADKPNDKSNRIGGRNDGQK